MEPDFFLRSGRLLVFFLSLKNFFPTGNLVKAFEPGFMLTSLLKQQKYILINWDTHQVLSGCSDDASTDLFVCKKNDTPAEID